MNYFAPNSLCSHTEHSQTHNAQSMYLPLQVFTILGRAHDHLSLRERRHLSKEWHLNSVAVSQTEICSRARQRRAKDLVLHRLCNMTRFCGWMKCAVLCSQECIRSPLIFIVKTFASCMVPAQSHPLPYTTLPSLITSVVSEVVCPCFPYNPDFCSKVHSEKKIEIEAGFGMCVCKKLESLRHK